MSTPVKFLACLLVLAAGAAYAEEAPAIKSKCTAAEEARIASSSAYINAGVTIVHQQMTSMPEGKMEELRAKDPEIAKSISKVMVFTAADEARYRTESAREICKGVTLAEHDEMAKFYKGKAGEELLRQQLGLMPLMAGRVTYFFGSKVQKLGQVQ